MTPAELGTIIFFAEQDAKKKYDITKEGPTPDIRFSFLLSFNQPLTWTEFINIVIFHGEDIEEEKDFPLEVLGVAIPKENFYTAAGRRPDLESDVYIPASVILAVRWAHETNI